MNFLRKEHTNFMSKFSIKEIISYKLKDGANLDKYL